MKQKYKFSILPICKVTSQVVLSGTILINTVPSVQAADFNCSLTGSGNWTDISNWSNCGGGFPNNNGQKYDITLSTSNNVSVNQAIQVDAFSLSSGSVSGDSNISVMKTTTWSRGQIGGDAGKVLARGGLSIEGNLLKALGRNGGTSDQGGLVNQGAGRWSGTGGFSNWNNGRFVNDTGASFDIQTDADFSSGFFENKGSLTKSFGATDGSNKTTISAEFTNTGSVDVQQGVLNASGTITQQGTVRIAENTIFSAQDLTNQGLITGDGTLKMTSNTSFINDARIAPGDGIGELTIDGDFVQTDNGIFEVTLAGTGEGEFDVMQILGDFTLDGVIEVSLADGFIPDLDDTFTIITSTGNWLDNTKFDSIVSVTNPGINFSAIYGADFVRLGVSQVPVPAALWLFGSALVGLLGVSRRKSIL